MIFQFVDPPEGDMTLAAQVNNLKTGSVRYNLFFRGQFLVLAAYTIAIIETLIAIRLDLTPITYKEALFLSTGLISFSILMIFAVYIKKEISRRLEWTLFTTYMIVYIIAYCFWVYKLQGLRELGLFTALMAVTFVLTYTSMLQSLLMSLITLAAHLSVIFYALEIKHQPGNIKMEFYLSFCLIPAMVLLSVAAYYVHKKRKEAYSVRVELEDMNTDLTEANIMLRFEQSRSKIEMELAHDIQRSIFPLTPPEDDAWDVAFLSVPSAGVSGDFYDFYITENRLKGISLFDVSGHGVASALITILAKPVFYRNFIKSHNESLDSVFEKSNRDLLAELGGVNAFITGIMLRLCGDRIEYINAGHPDLLLRNGADNSVIMIDEHDHKFKGHPIGLNSPCLSYKTHQFTAASGDVILMYSDCLLECRNESGEFYGDNRLFEVFTAAQAGTARGIMDYIVNDFYKFAGNNIHDDLTLIVLRKK